MHRGSSRETGVRRFKRRLVGASLSCDALISRRLFTKVPRSLISLLLVRFLTGSIGRSTTRRSFNYHILSHLHPDALPRTISF